MNEDKTDLKKAIPKPRSLLFLFVLLIRANPRLSAASVWWSELESNQPFGLFRPALIRLSYPTGRRATNFSRPPLLLVVHLVHHGTIVVHVHEQVLGPFGSRLCIVTKHDAFELDAQRRLRSQQG